MSSVEEKILSEEARKFLQSLHRQFNDRRLSLLKEREEVQALIDRGNFPPFHKDESIRKDSSWKSVPPPKDLEKRYVEITGPVERKMMINAFNSGADVFMADFEDALSPTWNNIVVGQENLIDAVRKQLHFSSPEGKEYSLNEKIATLIVRPRGWYLVEKHFKVDGQPISASLFDFGLFLFHNGKELLKRNSGPYFYLPKLESQDEAQLWNDLFKFSEKYLNLPPQSIKCTVLIETILAAFEMEEILYQLKDYIVGLNAGRWDYIFSIIKKFANIKNFNFPDRGQITMMVPFMRAYTSRLVEICHRRGAHAMGGMAAFIPNRKDKELNEKALRKVREDKEREISEGFDGTWVAHPDLVPVAYQAFEKGLNGALNQKNKPSPPIIDELLNFYIPEGSISLKGVQQNISVAIQYLESWLRGIGAVAIDNLMEDAATAEISRAQLWQWAHHGAVVDSKEFNLSLVKELMEQTHENLKRTDPSPKRMWNEAYILLKELVESAKFIDFLTIKAYGIMPDGQK